MGDFFTSNDMKWRLARTIVQGILGVIVAELPQLLDLYHLDPVWSAFIVALTMAILSPIMSALGDKKADDD